MRRAACLIAALPVPLCAQNALGGMKHELVSSGSSSPGTALGALQLLQMAVALGAVIGLLKWILPKVVSKMNRKITPTLGSEIHIEESAGFAGGSLYVVTARGKTLLISVSQNGVSCLSDLTCASGTPSQGPAFFEVFDQAVAPSDKDSLSETPAAIALERLERLSS